VELQMKVVAVLGSPRAESQSSTIAREILRGAKDAGNETVVYEIGKMNVRGCEGCGYCKEHNSDCHIEDDLKKYWKDLHECGALVLSSPNYYAQVTGPMITFMDRHYCLSDAQGGQRLASGKKVVGVFSQGSSDANAYMPQYRWYLKTFTDHGFTLAGTIVHAGEEPAAHGSREMQEAYKLGKSL
jgi:multimeric flavodoxin WrbA